MLYVSVNLFFSREQTFKKLVILVFSLIYKPSPLCADYHIPILVKFDFLYILMQTRGSVMKKIILMCLFGLMFSQTELTTKVYEFPNAVYEQQYQSFNLSDITNGELSDNQFAIVDVFGYSEDSYINGNCYLNIQKVFNDQDTDRSFVNFKETELNTLHIEWKEELIFEPLISHNIKAVGGDFIGTLKLAVTAEFPIEDTGYIEEGFDFCLVTGNNLVAFPCDNPVSVETALPELAQAEIQQIIGSGVASTNINGQFLGSLQNFTPGAGYWFKSSSSMCFNYTCTE